MLYSPYLKNRKIKKALQMNKIMFLIPALTIVFLGYLQVKTNIEKSTLHLISKPIPYFEADELSVLAPKTRKITNKNLVENYIRDSDVVIVNIFATWCPTCLIEHKQLLTLAQKYDIKIIGIGYKDTAKDIMKYMTKFGNPFAHIGIDDEGYAASGWGISGTPESFIVNADGKIRYNFKGPIREKDLEQVILPVIKQIRKDKGLSEDQYVYKIKRGG